MYTETLIQKYKTDVKLTQFYIIYLKVVYMYI